MNNKEKWSEQGGLKKWLAPRTFLFFRFGTYSEGVESTMSDVTYWAYSNVYYAPKEVMDNHFASQTRVESLATATYETHHHHHDDHSISLDDVRS